MSVLASLLFAVVAAQDPDALIEQLGDPDIDVREQAERKLVELGDRAVARLTRVAESGSSDVAGRARALLDRIAESAAWREAPTVTLDRASRTPAGFFEAIGKGCGVAIDAGAVDESLRVELAPHGWPLLRVLDEFCRTHAGYIWTQDEKGAVRIAKGRFTEGTFAYWGPLRLRLASVRTDLAGGASAVLVVADADRSCVRQSFHMRVDLVEARSRGGDELREGSLPGDGTVSIGGTVVFRTRGPDFHPDTLGIGGDITGGRLKLRGRLVAHVSTRDVTLPGTDDLPGMKIEVTPARGRLSVRVEPAKLFASPHERIDLSSVRLDGRPVAVRPTPCMTLTGAVISPGVPPNGHIAKACAFSFAVAEGEEPKVTFRYATKVVEREFEFELADVAAP